MNPTKILVRGTVTQIGIVYLGTLIAALSRMLAGSYSGAFDRLFWISFFVVVPYMTYLLLMRMKDANIKRVQLFNLFVTFSAILVFLWTWWQRTSVSFNPLAEQFSTEFIEAGLVAFTGISVLVISKIQESKEKE